VTGGSRSPVLDREDDGTLESGPREGWGGPQATIIVSYGTSRSRASPGCTSTSTPTDRDQDAELERLLKLGARPADVGQTGEEPWHVLVDPEDNEFCLLRARIDPV
jgi:hypothetical protein